MSNLIKAIHNVLAMSNLRASDTGVKSAGEFEGKSSPHGPRIKVVLGSKISEDADSVTVKIAKPAVVLGKLPAAIAPLALKKCY